MIQDNDALNNAIKRFANKPSGTIYKPNITTSTKNAHSKPFPPKYQRAESIEKSMTNLKS
jgi:hypothetical protein